MQWSNTLHNSLVKCCQHKLTGTVVVADDDDDTILSMVEPVSMLGPGNGISCVWESTAVAGAAVDDDDDDDDDVDAKWWGPTWCVVIFDAVFIISFYTQSTSRIQWNTHNNQTTIISPTTAATVHSITALFSGQLSLLASTGGIMSSSSHSVVLSMRY